MTLTQRQKSLIIAFTAFSIAGLTGLGLLLSDPADSFGLMVALLPVVLFVLLSFRDNSRGIFTIGSIIILFYSFFFIVRGLQLIIFSDSHLLISLVGGGDVKPILFGVGVAMTCFVIGYYLPFNLRLASYIPSTKSFSDSRYFKLLLILSGLFLTIAYVGLILLIIEHGGVSGVVDRFIQHTKIFSSSIRERFGMMLWMTFHPVGVWLVALSYAKANRCKFSTWLGVLLVLVCVMAFGVAVFIFGSRSQLLAVFIGVMVIYHWCIKRIPTRLILVGLPAVTFLSFWIVAYRTSSLTIVTIEEFLEIIGHNVLDVMIAIREDSIPIGFLASSDRWLQIPFSLVPRVLWLDKPLMTVNRLDWLVADYYRGGFGQTLTGYPSSMFSEWYLIGGWSLTVLVGWVFGQIVGVSDNWFSRQEHKTVAIWLYLPVLISMVYYFKDGDIVMSLTSSVKTIILCGFIYIFINFILRNSISVKKSGFRH